MKRFLAFALAVALGVSGAAQSIKQIRDVDILVELNRDGSAWITQVWNAQAGTSGTEFYIPVDNLGPMTISDLQVSENGVAYESLGTKWNVDKGRSYKAGKCGIVPKRDGVELCWGLGEAGDHVWTARFLVTGLVQAYDDADAFNFMFVNKGMQPAPRHAKVTVKPAFDCPGWTYDNTRVWAFGFYGDINVVDGTVVAETSESMSYSSSLIALVKFEKGVFAPSVVKGGPFQDLLDKALDGSSYGEDEDDGWALGIFGFLFLGGFALLIWMAIASALGYKWKKSLFGKTKIEEWYRDVPLDGNLFAAQFLLAKGKRFEVSAPANNLIGAFFLRWILNGSILVQPDPKSTKRVNLLFKADQISSDEIEEDLYEMARMAAGDNQLLEKNEFEKWSTKNYSKVTAWPDRAIARGRSWFRNKGYFSGKDGVCTEEGAREACHLVEFMNYLKNFTLTDQREAGEVKLWKEYMVYAQLFGIAEKVAQQFRKLYPAEFAKMAEDTGLNSAEFYNMLHWTNAITRSGFNNAANKAGNISGTGGHSSFGGGGGFSGGGFGGGGR